MAELLSATELEQLGAARTNAVRLAAEIERISRETDGVHRWRLLTQRVLSPELPVTVHQALFARNYADWDVERGPAPAWSPSADDIEKANLTRLMQRAGVTQLDQLAAWAAEDAGRFWLTMVDLLGIAFEKPPRAGLDVSEDNKHQAWLPGALMNIAISCFHADPRSVALIAGTEAGRTRRMTVRELREETLEFAAALKRYGIRPGDGVALVLPLTIEAVVAYLGIVLAGAVAVCIAESFAAAEVERRVQIGNVKLLITQDMLVRGGKTISLYERLAAANLPPMVVASMAGQAAVPLGGGDMPWENFTAGARQATPVLCDPDETMTLLFSSGTTADPKAIPWPHTTPIKCAADGFLYQDIHAGDVVTWPTSMGWMMGPWLIFAGLVNRATVALFDGHPASREFARFVEEAGVTIMGVIPSLVAAWSSSDVWNQADWSRIRLFSSTGECSQPGQMLALMSRTNYRPVIEYCGGTEIGGGYLTSTVLRPIAPTCFNQAALGLKAHIYGDDGAPADRGEVFLGGTAMGLSTRLINGDHHAVYYEQTPRDERGAPLRRHGDQLEQLPGGYYRVLGRADDAMNLGGIKVAAVEIERVLNQHPDVSATAAIAVQGKDGGPEELVVFVVPKGERRDPFETQRELQQLLRTHLNPLFQISRLEWIDELPRTASNKVMRRLLRVQAIEATKRL